MSYLTRKPHTIRPAKGESSPTQVVILAGLLVSQKHGESETTMLESVVALSTIRCRLSKGQYRHVEYDCVHPPESFWPKLYSVCYPGTSTVILGFDVYRLLLALGLWQEFDDGRLSFHRDVMPDESVSPNEIGLSSAGTCIVGSNTTIIVANVVGRKSTIRIIDCRNYGVDSLADLMNKPTPESLDDSDDSFFAVMPGGTLIKQCEAVRQWLKSYLNIVNLYGLGSFQHTVGSQAMHGWKKSYMLEAIDIHDDEDALKAERLALYSGRCECKFLGMVSRRDTLFPLDWREGERQRAFTCDSQLFHLDVNSMYPAVAQVGEFPTKYLGCVEKPLYDWVDKKMTNNVIIARCRIETTVPVVPLRIGGLVIWPVGEFTTTLCQPEIELALRAGCKVGFEKVWYYRRGRIFEEWVTALHGLRCEFRGDGDKVNELVVKRLLVALFGKFAQKAKRWQHEPDEACLQRWAFWREPSKENGLLEDWRCLAGKIERQTIAGEHPESFPGIMAFVTSYARVKLWDAISVIPHKHLFYYDTDSVIVDSVGLSVMKQGGMVDAGRLGAWKEVGQHHSIRFYGIKRYVADNQIVIAGVPKGSEFSESGQLAWQETERMDNALRRGGPPKAITQRRVFTMKTQYDHGWVDKWGWVHPFTEGGPVPGSEAVIP